MELKSTMIRYGNYTIYHGYHIAIQSIKDDDERLLLWYQGVELPFKNFTKSSHEENAYFLIINTSELKEAYQVQTFCEIAQIKLQLFPYGPNEEIIYAHTKSKEVINKLNFSNMHNSYYGKDFFLTDIDKIWEERSSSTVFNLPMPKQVEAYKLIKG